MSFNIINSSSTISFLIVSLFILIYLLQKKSVAICIGIPSKKQKLLKKVLLKIFIFVCTFPRFKIADITLKILLKFI